MNTQAIADFIKLNRKKISLTQQTLGDKLGVSPQAVSKWERGECLPDIAILPDLAKLFSVKLEDILQAGEPEPPQTLSAVTERLNAFLDENAFEEIKKTFLNATSILDTGISTDVFLILNNNQKDELLAIIMNFDDYTGFIDDILPYLNNNQLRQKLVEDILNKNHYEYLEPLMPFISNATKLLIVSRLLKENKFDELEEIITMLNKDHKNLIIDYIIENKLDIEILENFTPFFDRRQKERVSEYIV